MGDVTLGKLVRDRIPEIIVKDGKGLRMRILDQDEYDVALSEKLDEEVAEYKESHDISELVDILAVVYAIAENSGVSYSKLNELMEDKMINRGGFKRKIYLEEIFDNDD